MEELLELVMSNKLYLSIAVILGLFFIIALIKKVVKMIMLLLIIIAIFFGYLYYTGQNLSSTDKIMNSISETASELKEKGKDLIKDVTE